MKLHWKKILALTAVTFIGALAFLMTVAGMALTDLPLWSYPLAFFTALVLFSLEDFFVCYYIQPKE